MRKHIGVFLITWVCMSGLPPALSGTLTRKELTGQAFNSKGVATKKAASAALALNGAVKEAKGSVARAAGGLGLCQLMLVSRLILPETIIEVPEIKSDNTVAVVPPRPLPIEASLPVFLTSPEAIQTSDQYMVRHRFHPVPPFYIRPSAGPTISLNQDVGL